MSEIKRSPPPTTHYFNGETSWELELDEAAIRTFLWNKFGVRAAEEQEKVATVPRRPTGCHN
jgi:hypothetical protein